MTGPDSDPTIRFLAEAFRNVDLPPLSLADIADVEAALASTHRQHEAQTAALVEVEKPAAIKLTGPHSPECAFLLESLCAWLLHRFGPDSPEGKEAEFRLPKARQALAAYEGAAK